MLKLKERNLKHIKNPWPEEQQPQLNHTTMYREQFFGGSKGADWGNETQEVKINYISISVAIGSE